MTVGHMLATISSRELTEWRALYRIEAREAKDAETKGGR